MSRTRMRMFLAASVLLIMLISAIGTWYFVLPSSHVSTQAGSAPLDRLQHSSSIAPEYYFENGFPRFVLVRVAAPGEDSIQRAQAFLESHQDLYRQTNPNLGLEVRRISGVNDDSVTFYQTYLGLPVYGGELVVYFDGAQVAGTVGRLLTSDVRLDIRPMISLEHALDLARAAIGEPQATLVGETTTMVYDESIFENVPPNPQLVWRVSLGLGATRQVYLNAKTGEIVRISALEAGGFSLDLEDANGYSQGAKDCYWNTTDDDWIGDEDELDSDYKSDVDAVRAWNYSKDTYNFYKNNYGRDSYDNSGGEMEVYIHANVGSGMAQWIGGTGCNLIQFNTGIVAYDTMVHEFTHGVDYFSGYLKPHGQPGALRESFADVMAAVADGNWILGEDLLAGEVPMRVMGFMPVSKMSQYDPSASAYDNMGIPNKAAYLLAHGGWQNKWTVSGIPLGDLGDLYYSVLTGLPANASFMDARNASVLYAQVNWNTLGLCMVKNAFSRVELGVGDWECDGIPDEIVDTDKDSKIDSKDNCPVDYNPYQDDLDGDGQGDACDNDDDGDGSLDPQDNCPRVPNPGQKDSDNDGQGDLCDDDDNDAVLDVEDNCVGVHNASQIDFDQDGIGDACDPDLDGDGVNQMGRGGMPLDNCPFAPNQEQTDSDGDGLGDACDQCPHDADWIQAYTDVDPYLASLGVQPKPYQPDSDGDGIPDACDSNELLGMLPGINLKHALRPNGRALEFKIRGDPGDFLIYPIPSCLEQEGNGYPKDMDQVLTIQGLGPGIRAGLSDGEGRSAGSPETSVEMLRLHLNPQGGRDYLLHFWFGPEVEQGHESVLSVALFCIPGEREGEGDQSGAPQATATGRAPAAGVTASTPTLTPTPSATFTPSPTPTITPTPTPEICTLTSLVNLFCLPSPSYDPIDRFEPGQSAQAIAQTEYLWKVIGPNYGEECTIYKNPEHVQESGHCVGLPGFIPLPTITPTATPTRSPSRRIQACTVRQPGGAILCVSPCPAGASPGQACTP